MTWITIPNVFRGKGGQRVPVSQIDDDFQYLADKLNAFNPTGTPGGPGGIYEVRGLRGFNAVASPNTQYELTADAWMLRNPVDGSFTVQTAIGPIVNDITVPGPTPGGRDQAGAFASNSWIYIYAIWNPTTATENTVSSATPPPVGPALPSGFTMWGLAAAIRIDGGGNLVNTKQQGNWAIYTVAQHVVAAATPAINTETPVDVSAVVPPNALLFLLNVGASFGNVSTTSIELSLRAVTGEDTSPFLASVQAGSTSTITAQVQLPNIGQQYLYRWTMGAPSTPVFGTDHFVSGYSIPNGG